MAQPVLFLAVTTAVKVASGKSWDISSHYILKDIYSSRYILKEGFKMSEQAGSLTKGPHIYLRKQSLGNYYLHISFLDGVLQKHPEPRGAGVVFFLFKPLGR